MFHPISGLFCRGFLPNVLYFSLGPLLLCCNFAFFYICLSRVCSYLEVSTSAMTNWKDLFPE